MDSYRNYEKEARDLVQQLLSTSLERFKSEVSARVEQWPAGADLTVEGGQKAVANFIKA